MILRLFSKSFLILFLVLGSVPATEYGTLEIVDAKTGKKQPVRSKNNIVRIGIREQEKKVSLSSTGHLTAIDFKTKQKHVFKPGKYMLTSKGGQVKVNGKSVGKKARIMAEEKHFVTSNGIRYRGQFVAISKEGAITLINKLTVDDYLKGVLPREVVVSWPEETLRVQAVASRTYLVSHLGRHGNLGFDLCDEVHCQVYGGYEREHPRTTKAVDETEGEILLQSGKAIGAFFHSNCGGTTEQIRPVWGSPNKSYLPKKACKYGKGDPRYNWNVAIDNSVLLKKLVKKTKVKGKKIKSIGVKKKSASGRAETVRVVTDVGPFDLTGNGFRLAIGPERIRSTLWTRLSKLSKGYKFAGRGWGHGVGMCQWGAKGQAEAGRTYKQILQFYYPKTQMAFWDRSM